MVSYPETSNDPFTLSLPQEPVPCKPNDRNLAGGSYSVLNLWMKSYGVPCIIQMTPL